MDGIFSTVFNKTFETGFAEIVIKPKYSSNETDEKLLEEEKYNFFFFNTSVQTQYLHR